MALRPYQNEAIEAVLAARRRGLRRMLVCLPTGAGKTVIFSRLAQLAQRQVLVLAHREELLQQARDKLQQALGPGQVVAIERGAERASDDAKVLVCSMRSLHEERLARVVRGRNLGRVVIMHADLPLASTLDGIADDGDQPVAVVVPDRHGDGTPVLALPSAAEFEYAYGPGSCARHVAEAERCGLGVRVVHDHALGFDVDDATDLAALADEREPTP